ESSSKWGEKTNSISHLATNMIPSMKDIEKVILYPYSADWMKLDIGVINRDMVNPDINQFESTGLPHTMNMIAVGEEKSYHRLTCNMYLLRALAHYWRSSDQYGYLEQMMRIAEHLSRRRDLRGAAKWLLLMLRTMKLHIWRSPDSKITVSPDFQSSVRAKIYEYLGDIYVATSGTILFSEDELSAKESANQEKDIWTKILPLMRISKISSGATGGANTENANDESVTYDTIDDREDEFFYTLSGAYYLRNHQSLRACDVFLKKISVRQRRMFKTLFRLKQNNIKQQDGEKVRMRLEAVRSWCNIWNGVEKAIHILVFSDEDDGLHSSPAVNIRDRRRYGALLTKIGTTVLAAANFADQFRWDQKITDAEKEQFIQTRIKPFEGDHNSDPGNKVKIDQLKIAIKGNLDVNKSFRQIDRVFSLIMDNEYLRHRSQRSEGALLNYERTNPLIFELGVNSSLRRNSLSVWRKLRKMASKHENLEAKDNDNPLVEMLKRSRVNGSEFLLGLLAEAVESAKIKEIKSKKNRVEFEEDFRGISRTVHYLRVAEISLLGAFLSMNDNMNDLEAATAARSFGCLYLRSIELVLETRKMVYEYLNVDDALRLDIALALTYEMFHVAAKRYIYHAISIFKNEKRAERRIHQEFGQVYAALGDLLVIRAEAVEAGKWKCSNPGEGGYCNVGLPDRETRIIGLTYRWPALANLPGVANALESESEIRLQAESAYRNVLEQFLSETENYIKRYRFPNELFYLHRDIMDRETHYEICVNVANRHWDYSSQNKKRLDGSKAAEHLRDNEYRIIMALQEPNADGLDRQIWLTGIERVLKYVNVVRVGASYLLIDRNAKGKMQIKLKRESIEEQSDRADDNLAELKRFFRSYDDGLPGVYLDGSESGASNGEREIEKDGTQNVVDEKQHSYFE
ncbi:MAG: hypothetical protein IT350_17800, partial [Deltaproteobacteria bacterium]|nr:hypothetical protein [Deltaproteobacteria bacterium]